jgi:lysophospholipase L1-like esterase
MNADQHGSPAERGRGRRLAGAAVVAIAASLIMASGGTGSVAAPGSGVFGQRWTASWGPSPVVGSDIPGNSCPAGQGLTNQTVRNVAFLSAGGNLVRVRLSNAFGAAPLQVGHASVAVQAANSDAVPGTVRQLAFGGKPGVTIVAGADALSDPVPLTVAALQTLLVSVYLPGPTGPLTNHPFTAQGNFLASGDQALAQSGAAFADTPCWMVADGVDVRGSGLVAGSVVALGDSITDTANTTGNANRRWPDDLARRLSAKRGPTLSVVNAGLGGNRLLAPRDGQPYYGIPALARLDRDVLTQTAVRDVILLEGVNDIGFHATADEIIAAMQQIIVQTHARGLKILGGTITPFGGSFINAPDQIAARDAVNQWILTSHAFDGVIDFAKAVADPANPEQMLPTFDSGDHLHPNDAGCQAMANAVNLDALLR